MLACLLCGSFAQAQDESGQQALGRAIELHQSGRYAEAITEYQVYLKVPWRPIQPTTEAASTLHWRTTKRARSNRP